MGHLALVTTRRPVHTVSRGVWRNTSSIEAPGHHFESGQFDDALSVLILAMLFSWDCHVLSASRGPVFFTCHDEWSAFFVPPEQEAAPILASFSVWLELDDTITH